MASSGFMITFSRLRSQKWRRLFWLMSDKCCAYRAIEQGLDCVAVTDHNSANGIEAIQFKKYLAEPNK